MKKQRRIGIIYLIIALIGGYSMGYFPITFININDVEATFYNLQQHILEFKLAILVDVIVIVLEIFISIFIYNYFSQTDKIRSQIALISRLGMTFIMLLNIRNYIASLQNLINATDISEVFIRSIHSHFKTVYIWQLFFGIHMIVLSSLICKHFKSSRILSFGILVGGIGYLLDCIISLYQIEILLLSNTSSILLSIAAISEISFAILLLTKKK